MELNHLRTSSRILYVLLLSCSFLVNSAKSNTSGKTQPLTITDSNWTVILDGEWMIEFMAPWCPACKSFKEVWTEFAGWSHDLDISVGVVDVTENPGLSGRFLITSLPSLYHVKEGVFRQYQGGRKTTDLISVIDEKKWQKLEPVKWYRDPKSFQMGVVGSFFKAAMFIRGVYNMMVETYGIPEWACYVIFAVLTIVTGLLLGLLLVLCCDNFFPAKYIPLPTEPEEAGTLPPQDDTDLVDDTESKKKESEDSPEEKDTSSEPKANSSSGDGDTSGARKRNVKKDE